jgi:2-(1,2-epoxy-1,2-dihydrophenyl)acetyl-CoA isomerase
MGRLVEECARELHHAVSALRRAAQPVLASVHGAVAGAGMSLLAAADLAIAAADTRFTLAYSKIGASPDGGATYFLPRLVGSRRALELTLLADTFDAQIARDLGLVNWIADNAQLGAETARIAQQLARGASRALAETKRLVNQSFEQTLAGQLDAEVQAFARCAATRDFAEGVSAFVEKRKPDFKGN